MTLIHVETRQVSGAQAVLIDGPVIPGLGKLEGSWAFEVDDLDLACQPDGCGQVSIAVRCAFGDDQSDSGDARVRLKLPNALDVVGVVGYDGEVVGRIAGQVHASRPGMRN